MAGEGVRWADWEDILYANILERIEKMPYIPDDTVRIAEIDNIIYEEAEKLQNEFGVLYHPTGSIFSPSHIIHATLDDLYTQYNRPKEKSLVSIFAEGFSTGFKTGLWLAALQNSGYHKGPGCVGDEGTGKTGSLIIEEGGQFSASEIRAAEYMKNLGNDVKLRMPQGTRVGGGTSDLLVNGINYDVYTPTTNNVNRIISSMAGKNSQTTGIVLDLSETTVTAEKLGNVLARVRGIIEKGGKVPNITDIKIIGK